MSTSQAKEDVEADVVDSLLTLAGENLKAATGQHHDVSKPKLDATIERTPDLEPAMTACPTTAPAAPNKKRPELARIANLTRSVFNTLIHYVLMKHDDIPSHEIQKALQVTKSDVGLWRELLMAYREDFRKRCNMTTPSLKLTQGLMSLTTLAKLDQEQATLLHPVDIGHCAMTGDGEVTWIPAKSGVAISLYMRLLKCIRSYAADGGESILPGSTTAASARSGKATADSASRTGTAVKRSLNFQESNSEAHKRAGAVPAASLCALVRSDHLLTMPPPLPAMPFGPVGTGQWHPLPPRYVAMPPPTQSPYLGWQHPALIPELAPGVKPSVEFGMYPSFKWPLAPATTAPAGYVGGISPPVPRPPSAKHPPMTPLHVPQSPSRQEEWRPPLPLCLGTTNGDNLSGVDNKAEDYDAGSDECDEIALLADADADQSE